MKSSNQLSAAIQSELIRRHKATATTVAGLLVAVVLLSLVAYLGKGFFHQQQNPLLEALVRITIFVFGLGSVALRRTKFATMRLQDIGGLQGAAGLLRTLEKTTLQIALLAAVIAAMGFVATLATGNDFYTYGAGLVAAVVLLYGYPSRLAWERTISQFAPESVEIAPPVRP